MSAMTLFTDVSGAVADLRKAKPAYLQDPDILASMVGINDDIATSMTFPVLSIKGKVFTLKKDGENTLVMKPGEDGEVAQSINVAVIRANPNARHFYATEYVEGDEGSDHAPDCYSNDGVRPAADAKTPQADACATCPHSVWGTGKNGIGTACTVNTRLAIVAPEMLVDGGVIEPTLLRVPAASRKPFTDSIVKPAKRNNVPFNAMVVRVGFAFDAAGVKLTFKPVGFLSDAAYNKVRELYEDETVKAIVGVLEETSAAPQPVRTAPVETAEAAKPAKAPEPKAKPVKAPAPAPVAVEAVASVDDLLGDMLAGAESEAEEVEVAEEVVPPKPKPKPKTAKKTTPAPVVEADSPGEDETVNSTMSEIDALLGSFDD